MQNSIRNKLNIYYSSLLCSFLLLAFEQFAYTCNYTFLRERLAEAIRMATCQTSKLQKKNIYRENSTNRKRIF